MHRAESIAERLRAARELSWRHLGKTIEFYLPGMFIQDGVRGRYPVLSITGGECALGCDHCRGALLGQMVHVSSPDQLVARCRRLAAGGCLGVLISGGCDTGGRLPWHRFIPAIREVKAETGLFISVHSGLVDDRDALGLKQAGVDQALIDVIGDDETLRTVCHLPFGVDRIDSALAALQRAGIPVVPHIVCGIHYGRMRGEKEAVAMISRFPVQQVVIVSLMPIPGTPMEKAVPPAPEAVADIIAEVRFAMPRTPVSLGCARKRGNRRLELLAIDAGVNRMALPSEEAAARAASHGLAIHCRNTCCSVGRDLTDRPVKTQP
ncbi:radical SAM protein [Desulfococcus sp.]|uniref:radical SAM protein n=1 Tax=Desulfococcus sp. TaxID=2025834 RepID=UPI00359346CA